MPRFNPVDTNFEDRVCSSFDQQQFMKKIGVQLVKVEPGIVVLELDFDMTLTQQHGYVHAGVITTMADNSCGYAAYSLMPANSEVLTVEFKVNFLAPAIGKKFEATGRVIKPGRTLTICSAEVFAREKKQNRLICMMQATMMCVLK